MKKRFLQIIEQQSNRLIDLVENILSVNKIQSSELILTSAKIDTLLEPVLLIIRQQYPHHIFELNLKPQLPNILVDKDRFQQIMTNLIENAAKYGDYNSSIKIETGFCKNCEYVSIKISNIGDEIKKEDYDKIFTKFSRIDSPLTRRVQGSGLGLYITKNLIEKMQGNIKVFSNKDKKETEFLVYLPIYEVEKLTKTYYLYGINVI